MRRQFWAGATLAVLAMGCASGRPTDTSGALTTRESNVIALSEISQAQGLITAWDAVIRLRPRFLRNPGRSSLSGGGDNRAIVRVNEVDTGLPEVLRTIEIQQVKEIRYYSAVDATSRFGGTHGRGVIHVILK